MEFSYLRERLLGPSIVRRVRRDKLTFLSPEKVRRLLHAAEHALRREKGDVLEFGIALGGSAALLASKARKHGCRFAGFDVFGMPPPPTLDRDGAESMGRYDVVASGEAAGIGGDSYYGYRDDLYDAVCDTFARYGLTVDGRGVQMVKGLIEDTWPQFPSGPVAIAHVDCVWHDPVKYSLEAAAPLLTKSGRIVVDSYHHFDGCRAAVDQFLVENREFVMDAGENPILRRAG